MNLQPTAEECLERRLSKSCGVREAYSQILKENILEALEKPCTQAELRFILRTVVKGMHSNALSA